MAYTTDDDRFLLVDVEIKLLHKLSYRRRRSVELIRNDSSEVKNLLGSAMLQYRQLLGTLY